MFLNDVDGGIGNVISSNLLVGLEAASVVGVGLGVWLGPSLIEIFPVLVIGVSGLGVVKDPIGFGVSSVEDRVLGVEVFGFSDVDLGIGFGVTSTLLVVVIAVSAEGVSLGVWSGSDVGKTFPVLIIGVVADAF